MARFKLIRTPQGLILTTELTLSPANVRAVRAAVDAWKEKAPDGVLIATDTEFIDLDLSVDVDEVSIPLERGEGGFVAPAGVAEEVTSAMTEPGPFGR